MMKMSLERKLRLEKVVASKLLRLAMEMEEERRARLENDTATIQLRLAMEMDKEKKARLEKKVATTRHICQVLIEETVPLFVI